MHFKAKPSRSDGRGQSRSDDRVRAVLVENIYEKAGIGIVGTIVISCILAASLRGQIGQRALSIWVSVTILSAIMRWIGLYKFKKAVDWRKNFRWWGKLQDLGLLISGILWGSTAIFLYPKNSIEHQVLIAFVLAGMVAGAVGAFSARMSAFLAFSIPALLPIIVRFFISNDMMHMAMGMMTFIFAVLVFATAKKINRSAVEQVALKESFSAQLEARTKELKNSEDRFHTLADNISPLCWMADPVSGIFWFNKRWYEFTGSTYEESAGWGWKKFQHPDFEERVFENLKRSFEAGKAWEDVMPLRGESGEYRWFLSRALPVCDETGKVTRWFGTNTDITERLQAEQSLQQAHDRLEEKVRERTAELEQSIEEIKALAHKTIQAMENDRRALSKELHDSVGGTLAAVMYQLESRLENRGPEPSSKDVPLEKIISYLRLAISESRRITKQLRPSVLDDFGLEAAIRNHLKEFRRFHPQILVDTEIGISEQDLSGDSKTTLYRVLQEALNNVAKHSQADSVQVKVSADGGSARLQVKDNGVGFDPGEVLSNAVFQASYGLRSMRERVEICNGKFRIESAAGKGTEIAASVPLEPVPPEKK